MINDRLLIRHKSEVISILVYVGGFPVSSDPSRIFSSHLLAGNFIIFWPWSLPTNHLATGSHIFWY